MKPYVYFSCATCGWRKDVPDRFVFDEGGLPRSAVAFFHDDCTGEPDVTERGGFEANLYCETPGYNIVLKL